LPIASQVHLVPVNSARGIAPTDLEQQFPADHPPVEVHENLKNAFKVATLAPTLVTGSTFLVGEAKAIFTASDHRASAQ